MRKVFAQFDINQLGITLKPGCIKVEDSTIVVTYGFDFHKDNVLGWATEFQFTDIDASAEIQLLDKYKNMEQVDPVSGETHLQGFDTTFYANEIVGTRDKNRWTTVESCRLRAVTFVPIQQMPTPWRKS